GAHHARAERELLADTCGHEEPAGGHVQGTEGVAPPGRRGDDGVDLDGGALAAREQPMMGRRAESFPPEGLEVGAAGERIDDRDLVTVLILVQGTQRSDLAASRVHYNEVECVGCVVKLRTPPST